MKQYVVENTELLSKWDEEKNSAVGLDPTVITTGSHKEAWWKCGLGHSWKSAIYIFYHRPYCPFCKEISERKGRKLVFGFNDLQTCYPLICAEWNYDRNAGSPKDYFKSSNKKVWWKCNNGHEWEERISARTTQELNCPYCSKKKATNDYNLLKCFPELCEEWDYEKNGDLQPSNFTPHSNVRVWWKCKYGHNWKTGINNRTNGTNCPVCKMNLQTSFPEQAILYYLKKNYESAINNDKSLGFELDIFIPEIRTAIEYDGVAFHRTERKRKIDADKNALCRERGIVLIRVLEKGLSTFNNCVCITRTSTTTLVSLEEAIKEVYSYLQLDKAQINLARDYNDIVSSYLYDKGEKSLQKLYPNLVEEWDYSKNGNLTPDLFTTGSAQLIWWKCSKKHSWQARIYTRCKGHGCPICGRDKTIRGKNKPVLCVETNEIFESIKAASLNKGLHPMSIIRCCQGNQKQSGGFSWKYLAK